MKLNFFKAVQELSINNLTYMEQINEIIQDRLIWLEEREPDSDGAAYDKWAEKYDDWDDIVDLSERIYETSKGDSDWLCLKLFENNINKLKEFIEDYQLNYGGLSRLYMEV